MSSYDEFCAALDLDTSASDSRAQYSQYRDAHAVLMAIVGKDNTGKSPAFDGDK